MRAWRAPRAPTHEPHCSLVTACWVPVCSVWSPRAGLPDWLARDAGVTRLAALRGMFVVYGVLGLSVFWLYRRLLSERGHAIRRSRPLGRPGASSCARGLVQLGCLCRWPGGQFAASLWLFERFGLSLAQAGASSSGGIAQRRSQFAAPMVARRIGLLNTMVFTHIPATSADPRCLGAHPALALGLLFVRSALSQMDVPTRTAS